MKTIKVVGVLCWLILVEGSLACFGAPVDQVHALRLAARWHALSPHPMRRHAGHIGKISTYFNAAGQPVSTWWTWHRPDLS